MKSASKAAPGEITRKFLDKPEEASHTKQAYSIRISPCIEYDEKGNVIEDAKHSPSDIFDEKVLKATLGLLASSLELVRNL